MSEHVQIASYPDPDNPDKQHDHLWVLVGGGDNSDKSRAFYLGNDRDIEGDDIASPNIGRVIDHCEEEGLTVDRPTIEESLRDYRRARGT